MRIPLLAVTLAAAILAQPAAAWTRPGHMVTAAIAYGHIEKTRPELLDRIAAILEAHPDRGPFEVAVDRTTGKARQRRLFLECARWPDDARRTLYDHPGWHAVLWPVQDKDAPPTVRDRLAARAGRPTGQALEGLALNTATLGDPMASASQKAMSLCWVLHVAADIHQPFHTAELFSAAYPNGDAGGGRQFVQDPLTEAPISLHWLWDDSIHRSGLADEAGARAREIEKAYPRANLEELKGRPGDFAAWARESHELAVSFALPKRGATSPSEAAAPKVDAAYWNDVKRISERRIAVAGSRMADLVIQAMDAPN